MSCLYKIREGLSTFTGTEKRLAEFIIEHKDEVVNDSALVLGNKVNTSAAAVVRFAKKLGYKGFTAMKVDLAKDNSDDDFDFDELINANDTIDTLVKKAYVSNFKTLEQTYKLINVSLLNDAIETLKYASHIYLFGVGGSGVVCDDFMQKLSRINRNVIYHKDFHVQMPLIAHMTEGDVVIAISYSGKTKEILAAVQHAKAVGAKVVAITQFNKNPLNKMADIVLHVPNEEKELRMGAVSSRIASLVITDLLFYGIAKENAELTRELLVKTRSIVQNMDK